MPFTFKLARRLSQVRMWMLIGVLFGACSDQQGINDISDPGQVTSQVASIEVSPGSTALVASQSTQFAATIRDTRGSVVAGVVTWSSSDATIVTVTSTGVVTAIRAGTATIRASSSGKTGSSSVTVTIVSPPPPPGQAPDTVVASVTVSPASATVGVLGTWQFTATAKNAAGSILTGQQLSWSSSAPLIASVNSNGFATGVLGGSATITASVSGRSGSASVTVTAAAPPPPPPPTGGWTYEPAGFTNLTENPFNALTPAGWGIANNAGNTTIASDAGAPGSPSSVIEFKYPSGYPGGAAPATVYYSMPATQNVYAGFWWKPSAGWQGHPSGVNKIAFLYSGVGQVYLAMYGPPGGPFHIRVERALDGMGLPVLWFTPNVNPVNVTLGAWHKMEWLINGTHMQFWMDGTLLGDYNTFPIVTGGFGEFQLSPTWGGMGDTKTQTDYYWYDHVRLSK